MNIQLLIYLVLLAALFTTTIMIGRAQRKLESLRSMVDLIAASPAVCYSCRQYGAGDPLMHVDGLQDHVYVEARLVYIPDELLRWLAVNIWRYPPYEIWVNPLLINRKVQEKWEVGLNKVKS